MIILYSLVSLVMKTNQDKQQKEDKMNIQEIERIGNEAQKRKNVSNDTKTRRQSKSYF